MATDDGSCYGRRQVYSLGCFLKKRLALGFECRTLFDETGVCRVGDCGLRCGAKRDHDLKSACDEYSNARSFLRGAGFRPELAWTCSEFADLLLDRDAPGDREKATELQDEAIAIATELGMKPLLERVLAQREILKA